MAIDKSKPEYNMWCAALELLIDDAIRHAYPPKKVLPEYERAYKDLLACGEITRRLCAFTGHDPKVISYRFRVKMKELRRNEK